MDGVRGWAEKRRPPLPPLSLFSPATLLQLTSSRTSHPTSPMPVATAPANGAPAATKAGALPYDDPTEHYSDLQRARLDYVPPKPVVLQGEDARGERLCVVMLSVAARQVTPSPGSFLVPWAGRSTSANCLGRRRAHLPANVSFQPPAASLLASPRPAMPAIRRSSERATRACASCGR
jgi:hypothetical protein